MPGMAASQANALQPGLRAETAAPAEDEAALQGLAAWCLRFTPLVSPAPPDGVWLDVTGCAHLWGGEEALLSDILARLADAGIAGQAGLASTPGCAHAAARHGPSRQNTVPQGGEAAFLAPLPVSALRLDPAVAEALHRLGFDRIGQLHAAPRAPLTRRFGAGALRRLDQALGQAPEPLAPITPPALCRSRQRFAEPVATPEDLARATALLAESLCARLLRRGQGACLLDLVFQRVDGEKPFIRAGTALPTRDAAHLTRLLTDKIETIDPGFGIEEIFLTATRTAPLGARQSVSSLAAEPEADLAALVDTIANRLGPDAIFRAEPVESDIPERSLRRVPPLPPRPMPVLPPWPRPPRLLHPPRRIEAMALLPDHAPVQFIWRRKPHRIRRADGPERVHGEWWRNDAETFAHRDYFQVESETGQRFWVFRDEDMVWYLQGVFG